MADRLFITAILLFAATFLLLGLFHFEYPWPLLRFPFGIGVAIITLCLADLFIGARRTDEPSENAGVVQTTITSREAVRGMLWVLGVLPAIYLLGYAAGLSLYILVALKFRGHGWLVAIVTAAGGFAVTYFLFIVTLGVPLPLLPAGF